METQEKAVEVRLPFLCSHKLWRRGNRHLLVCFSTMSGGGVSVLEKALDHLRGLKVDDEDKMIQLSNSGINAWKWRGPLNELPFKNSQEGNPKIGDGPIRVYDAHNLEGPKSGEVPDDVLEALGDDVTQNDNVDEFEEITERQFFRRLGIHTGTKVTVEVLRLKSFEHPFVVRIASGKVVYEWPFSTDDTAPF